MEDRTVYEGEWKEDKREGRGKQNYLNGQQYEVCYSLSPSSSSVCFRGLSTCSALRCKLLLLVLCKKSGVGFRKI